MTNGGCERCEVKERRRLRNGRVHADGAADRAHQPTARASAAVPVAHVHQPVVDEFIGSTVDSRSHASTTVMTANNHMLDLQDIDRILDHRHAVRVRFDHKIGEVAVNEKLPRPQAYDFIRRYATVGTSDPQKLGLMPTC